MPKVLHLRTITGHGGGPEKTLLHSPRFIGTGYSLELAYIRPENDPLYDMPARAGQLGVVLIDIPERGKFDLRTLRKLSSHVKHSSPDIIHAHDYKTNMLAVLLSRWHGVPAMTTVHGYVTHSKKLNLYYRLDRWALRRMEYVVAVSHDLLEALPQWGVPQNLCLLVENAIDTVQFARRRSTREAKQQLGIAPNRLVIGTVGRLSAEKGFDRLVAATDRLLQQGFDLELIILGDGDERDHLESLIAKLDRADRIRLVGYQSDLLDYYHAMDVLAISSLREGLPNVLLEALATEVPVVATRVGGVPQVIQDGQHGLLVEPNDVDQLTSSLSKLLGDCELRQRLAAAGRQLVEQRFSFAVRMQRIRAIYDKLLGRASSGGSGNGSSPNEH